MDWPELPDLFASRDGTRVRSMSDWGSRRAEIRDVIVATEYGGLPLCTAGTTGELLHFHVIERYGNARHSQYRLRAGPGPGVTFLLDILAPAEETPHPVLLNGDGCWRTLTDDIIRAALDRGYVLAQFNRVEIAPDAYRKDRTSGLYALFPEETFGAIAAWAWGFQRCVDFLLTLEEADHGLIAATGHSRGGKAALLAGATDERIALTAPNGSGCGGAGCYRFLGPGAESLADILGAVPYWFGDRLASFVGREASMPFDQHFLKALVAPRPLLSTEALGDLWANPSGTWLTHAAAAEAYRLLGAGERIGIHYRPGGHEHAFEDWKALLDFADWQWKGVRPGRDFGRNPFAS